MAFVIDNFGNISANGKTGIPDWWTYNALTDTLADVQVTGYFNGLAIGNSSIVKADDIIYVQAADGNEMFIVTNATSPIAVQLFGGSEGIPTPLRLVGEGDVAIPGTVAITNGSNAVTGTATTFTDLAVGQAFNIDGHTNTVLDINSDTSVTLLANYTGPTVTTATAFTDSDFIVATSSDGIDRLIIGPSGSIETPLNINNILTGAYKAVINNSASIYVPLTAAMGLINCTNTGAVLIGLSASTYNLPVGYTTTVYLSGSGTIGFFTGGSDTMTVTPFSAAMGQGSVARIKLIAINSGNGVWSVDIVGNAPSFSYSTPTFSMTGPWASAQNATLLLNKSGVNGTVTMNLSAINSPINGATNNTPIQGAIAIPTAFFPKQLVYSAPFLNYGTTGNAIGSMNVTTGGLINIVGADLNVPNFAGTTGVTTVGYVGITMSWIAAN